MIGHPDCTYDIIAVMAFVIALAELHASSAIEPYCTQVLGFLAYLPDKGSPTGKAILVHLLIKTLNCPARLTRT